MIASCCTFLLNRLSADSIDSLSSTTTKATKLTSSNWTENLYPESRPLVKVNDEERARVLRDENSECARHYGQGDFVSYPEVFPVVLDMKITASKDGFFCFKVG